MLKWAIIFLIIALIAGALGFTNVAVISGDISKILFFVFMVLFLIALAFAFWIV